MKNEFKQWLSQGDNGYYFAFITLFIGYIIMYFINPTY